jgi:glycosyltransferase involved in cell wall biosynthesis
LEVLIVDDGSSDGTKATVESFLEGEWEDRNIRYVFQDNSGASSARNNGLVLAEGDYVQFLDSDDELLPGKLKKQVSFLHGPNNSGCQMCYCYGRMGESVGGDCERIGGEAASVEELLLRLASREVHVMQTSAPLWRRSYLIQHNGWNPEIGLGDDLEYHVRLMCSVELFGFVPEELFFVRVHQENRLSRDTMARESLTSAVRTQQSVQACLERGGYWHSGIRARFFGKMRIVYANCLSYGTREDVAKLETWLKGVGDGDSTFRKLFILICCRRLFGGKVLLFLHQRLMKLRGHI